MELGLYLFAILSPLLYATTNHLDKLLLEKYFRDSGVEVLLLFSGFLACFVIPVLWIFDPTVIDVTPKNALILTIIGVVNTILLWAYLQAMFTDEPVVVITYYQLVPVIALGFDHLVFDETFSKQQLIAMALIIIGAITLSFYIEDTGVIRLRGKTFGFMLLASVCWAFESTLFKLVAIEDTVSRSFFWEHVALVIISVLIFVCSTKYRQAFLSAVHVNSRAILSLNALNEMLYIGGNFIAAIVVVLIPVSVTLLMNSFQPLFVFMIGFIVTILFPSLGIEYIKTGNLLQKVAAITLTIIGAIMIGEW